MVTVSDFEGHLRIRDERLKNPLAAEAIRDALAESPEVYQSRANARAGSILILYRHSTGVRERIMERLTAHLRQFGKDDTVGANDSAQKRPLSSRARLVSRRKAVNYGMMASLALSLLGAVLDRKRFHVFAGILFLGMLGFHLSGKKRQLFA
jgi:hypothetical protein